MYFIYTKPGCSFCVKAKAQLNRLGLDFEETDITQDALAYALFKANGWKTVPQIFHDDTHIGGYDDLVKYLAPDSP